MIVMSTFLVNLESFGAKTQKLWQIIQAFLAIA